MKVVTTVEELRGALKEERRRGKTIGFVPTMGYLHAGHLSLVQKAKETADVVVMSIFVNPTQFGPNEDYESYPRDFERDRRLAEEAGVDVLFHPPVSEIYPGDEILRIEVTRRVDVLCGKSRPGHFDGVATVLIKLFNIVQPDYAFFGLKDAQQVAVVEGLIRTLHIPVQLVPCETVREEDGLAMSSRNVRLNPDERKEAVHLNQALDAGVRLIESGERERAVVREAVRGHLERHLRLGEIDYVDVLTYPGLEAKETIDGRTIIAVAVRFKNARLIDNKIVDVH
jgi:pantoate--beta-alanine ligase